MYTLMAIIQTKVYKTGVIISILANSRNNIVPVSIFIFVPFYMLAKPITVYCFCRIYIYAIAVNLVYFYHHMNVLKVLVGYVNK